MSNSSFRSCDRLQFKWRAAALLTLGAASILRAQTSPLPVLSPFEQKALLAFAPAGAVFANLTLSGSVSRTAGSTRETGTVTLHSSVDGSSTETWSGAGGNRVVTCTAWTGVRSCTISISGTTKELDGAANQRTVGWFSPWTGISLLSSLATTATESTDATGDEVLSFAPSYGSLAGLPVAKQKQLQQIAQHATVQVLFDAGTALPSGMRYTEPLSSELSNAIDVSIVYGDYRLEQGFMLPHNIQRFIQRTLESDIHITSVSLN